MSSIIKSDLEFISMQWSPLLIDCVLNKRAKRVKDVFDTLIAESGENNLDDCWFDFLENGKPVGGLQEADQHKLSAVVLYWLYLLANEKIKVRKLSFVSILHFLLKCKLLSVIAKMLPPSPHSYNPSAGLFLALFTVKEIVKQHQLKESTFTRELLEISIVEFLVPLTCDWQWPCLIHLVAIDILHVFCIHHREACERIMHVHGYRRLAKFIYKDWAERKALSTIKNRSNIQLFKIGQETMLYETYENSCIISVQDITWKIPLFLQPEAAAFIRYAFLMKRSALKILKHMADMNNRYRMTLYLHKDITQPLVAWLGNPTVNEASQAMYQLSTEVLTAMMNNEDVAKRMIREHPSLIENLHMGLYSAGWHIAGQYWHLMCAFVKHGGVVRDALAKNKKIFEALINHLYCIDEDIQPRIMGILEGLGQSESISRELNNAGLSPKLVYDTTNCLARNCEGPKQHPQRDCFVQKKVFMKYIRGWSSEERKVMKYCKSLLERTTEENKSLIESLKDRGSSEFKKHNYSRAIECYTQALYVCPLRIKCEKGDKCPSWCPDQHIYHWWIMPALLLANRAQCQLNMHQWKKAVQDASRAICCCWGPREETDQWRQSVFLKATFRRARAWLELKEYRNALNDIACVVEHEPFDQDYKDFYTKVLLMHRRHHKMELVRHCGACGAGEGFKLRRCAGCDCQTYCSRACQVDDWKDGGHKLLCAQVAHGSYTDFK